MDKAIITLKIQNTNEEYELEIPINITVKELCHALNVGLRLEERNIDISNYYIKTFNPLSFIKGRDFLKDYGIRNGTIIELV